MTGRFTSQDLVKGFAEAPYTQNQYTYCWNDPINLVDLDGNIPTPREAAEMADYIYGRPGGGSLSGGWALQYIYDNNGSRHDIDSLGSGNFPNMKIGVFARINPTTGEREYSLVNRGTVGPLFDVSWSNGTILGPNWGDNRQQLSGNSQDMDDAMRIATEFVNSRSGFEVAMIGHSKGGAEAVANGVATNTNVIVFNPMSTNLSALGLSTDTYTANMVVYVVEGDALNVVFGGVSRPIGELIMLDRQYGASRWRIFSRIGNLGYNHGMAAILTALDERYRFSNGGCE